MSVGAESFYTRLYENDHFPMLRHPPGRGYFGLQNHGVGAEFRNIRLFRLEPEK